MSLLSKKMRDEKRAHWKKLILEWKESGLSQTAFCRQRNLKYANFVHWRRRFKSREQELVSAPALLPIRLRATGDVSSKQPSIIQITLGNGKRIDLPIDVSPEQLRAVISSL